MKIQVQKINSNEYSFKYDGITFSQKGTLDKHVIPLVKATIADHEGLKSKALFKRMTEIDVEII